MKRYGVSKGSRCSAFALIAIAAVLFFVETPAYPSEQAVARLTQFSGIVIVQSKGDWGAKPEIDLPLYSMDKVVTRTGTAVVTFKDGAVVEIRPNSNLLIEEQEKAEGASRNLRLLLGKVSFKTGVGSKTRTNLQTPTAVAGLRGTAGVLSIGIDGKSFIQFTEGGMSYSVGDFIAGVAKDVPPELADLNPAQRAAFVASAAADQAKNAAQSAKEGKAPEAQSALASAKAAEAAAVEAKTAAQAMINNPSGDVAQQAQTIIQAADKAIEAAKEAEKKAIDAGAKPTGPVTYTPPSDTKTPGFDVKPPVSDPPVTIPPTLPTTTTPPTTETPVTTTAAAPTTTVPLGFSAQPTGNLLQGTISSSDLRRGVALGPYDYYYYEYFTSPVGLIFGSKEYNPGIGGSTEEIYLPDGLFLAMSGNAITRPLGSWSVGSKAAGYFSTPPGLLSDWTREWYEERLSNILYPSGTVSGVFGVENSFWSATPIAPANWTVQGSYSNASPSVFSFPIDSNAFNGGALAGYLVGILGASTANGLTYSIYVDPSQKAGILRGGFDGPVDPAALLWSGSGSVYSVEVVNSIGFSPSELGANMEAPGFLYGGLVGTFPGSPTPYIYNNVSTGWSRSIKGQDWGVYSLATGFESFLEATGTWNGRAGGGGEFGTHLTYGSTPSPDMGIWMTSPMTGNAMNGFVQSSYTGRFLTQSKYGTLGGEIVGSYNLAAKEWQAASAGHWEKTQPLSFMAYADEQSNIRVEVKGFGGDYPLPGGDAYHYWYNEALDQGGYTEQYLGTITHAGYRDDYKVKKWTETIATGALGYGTGSWSGSLLDTLRSYDHDHNPATPPVTASLNGPFYSLNNFGWIDALIGGLQDPWAATAAAPAQIVLMGEYSKNYSKPGSAIFDFTFASYNPYYDDRTIWNQQDNSRYGAFRGLASGRILSSGVEDTVDGGLLGLFVDPAGNLGVLKGSFLGKGYPYLEMWESTIGTLYPIRLTPGAGMLPADLYANTVLTRNQYTPPATLVPPAPPPGWIDPWPLTREQYWWWGPRSFFVGPSIIDYPPPGVMAGFGADGSSGSIDLMTREITTLGISGQPWSISQVIHAGTYSGSPSDSWLIKSDFIENNVRKMTVVDGSRWSSDLIEGKLSGAWVNLNMATTGVFGGELKGTFNANNLTWQTVSQITSMSTEKFLGMINAGQTDPLTKLNIPCIQVGVANLAQGPGTVNNLSNVVMNDVKFFAYSTGAPPKIWATSGIGGSYSGAGPQVGGPNVPLSGNGLSATFGITKWDTGTWAANVNGGGTYSGAGTMNGTQIQMKGAAAGQINAAGPGTFGGTGTGVVKTVP